VTCQLTNGNQFFLQKKKKFVPSGLKSSEPWPILETIGDEALFRTFSITLPPLDCRNNPVRRDGNTDANMLSQLSSCFSLGDAIDMVLPELRQYNSNFSTFRIKNFLLSLPYNKDFPYVYAAFSERYDFVFHDHSIPHTYKFAQEQLSKVRSKDTSTLVFEWNFSHAPFWWNLSTLMSDSFAGSSLKLGFLHFMSDLCMFDDPQLKPISFQMDVEVEFS